MESRSRCRWRGGGLEVALVLLVAADALGAGQPQAGGLVDDVDGPWRSTRSSRSARQYLVLASRCTRAAACPRPVIPSSPTSQP